LQVVLWSAARRPPPKPASTTRTDSFTIAEIARLEGLGVVPLGEGGKWTESGGTVNGTDGGSVTVLVVSR
jgi:hypothetical protein